MNKSDTREAFEAWRWSLYVSKHPNLENEVNKKFILSKQDNGKYTFVQPEWEGYQAATEQSQARIGELEASNKAMRDALQETRQALTYNQGSTIDETHQEYKTSAMQEAVEAMNKALATNTDRGE